jgi:hypothetical protein
LLHDLWAAGICCLIKSCCSIHALQPEQLIARLPPEYYVVLPEVNANISASNVTLSNALEHIQVLNGKYLHVSCLL